MVSMKIPAKTTTREFYIARRNVKGILRYACYWTDTNAYVRDERVSKNDAEFVYNPQIFSSTYDKTLTKMRTIFPLATLTVYAENGTQSVVSSASSASDTTGRIDVAKMRGTVSAYVPPQDVPAETEDTQDVPAEDTVDVIMSLIADAKNAEDNALEKMVTNATTGRGRGRGRGRK